MLTQKDKIVLDATPPGFNEFLIKIWQYRVLIWVFAKRDLKVKYAQTIFGWFWVIIHPITGLVIYSVFGQLFNYKISDYPFPIYVLSGLISWNYFSFLFINGVNSIQESNNIIKKINFPKVILPLSKVIGATLEITFSLLIFILLCYYFKYSISTKFFLIPFLILFNSLPSLILVYWISLFSIFKKDLLHTVPFILNFGIWVTQVFFIKESVPYEFQLIVSYNPLDWVIEAWRWCLIDKGEFEIHWVFSFLIMIVILVLGMFLFYKKEDKLTEQ